MQLHTTKNIRRTEYMKRV